jgi:hypothetical protein
VHRRDDRARERLAQALAGAGGGVAVLGLVAGARLYDRAVLPVPLALIGTGLVAAYLVACAVRWRAQPTAALGIGTALLAAPLVGAPASLGTAAFVAVALAAAGTVVVACEWRWLGQLGLVATAPQLWSWLAPYRDSFADGTASTALALGVAVAIGAWWVLVAAPAVALERHGGARRAAPLSLLLGASAAATLVGLHATAFDVQRFGAGPRLVGLVLLALHLAAAAFLWRRPQGRPGALLVIAAGAVVAAILAASVVGGAGQAIAWAAEAVGLLWLGRRERDRQSLAAAAAIGFAAVLRVLLLVPPLDLAYGDAHAGRTILLAAVLPLALAAAARIDRRRAPFAAAWAGAAYLAALYGGAAVAVTLVAPTPGARVVDQVAQLAASGALVAVTGGAALAGRRLAARADVHAFGLAAGAAIAVKVLAVDVALARTADAAAAGLPLLVLGLLVVAAAARGGRMRRGQPALAAVGGVAPALPALGLAVAGLLAYVGPLALASGTDRLAAAAGIGAAAVAALAGIAVAPVAERRALRWGWREGRRGKTVVAALGLAALLGALACATLGASHAGSGPVEQRAQVLVSAWLAAVVVAALVARRHGFLPARLAAEPALPGLALAGKIVAVDALALGRSGRALWVDVAVLGLAAVAAWQLDERRDRSPRLGVAAVPALAALAALGLGAGGLAPVDGTTSAWLCAVPLAAAAVGALLVARRVAAPRAWRAALVFGSLAAGAWTLAAVTVTVLTPDAGAGHVSRAAQVGLSLALAAYALGIVGVGLMWRGELATLVRRAGIPLLGAVAAKVLLYDTAHVTAAQRAGVFVGLGAAFLVGAFIYTRLLRLLAAPGLGGRGGPRPAA